MRASRTQTRTADTTAVRRVHSTRDRIAWLIALVALDAVVSRFVPVWIVAAAVVVLVGAPLLIRRHRRHARR
jgi:hypothetical protein